MFGVRRLRISPRFIISSRSTTTAQVTTDPSKPPPPDPTPARTPSSDKGDQSDTSTGAETSPPVTQPKTRGRNVQRRRQRPKISLKSPREWNRPLAPGVLPAYDLALSYIRKDSASLKAEAKELSDIISKEEAADKNERNEEELENLRKKLNILQVQSEVNLPEVRWKCSNAMADMSKPVYRHLMEQRWRKEGDLDLLMERIHQMKVVPDVLPDLYPSLDLRITTLSTIEEYQTTKKMYTAVEPGVYLLPHQTRKPPKVYANIFHPDERLYTLLMVDPDVPDEENSTFTTYLHWMKPNIPLSATNQNRITGLNSHTHYIPPHPQRGTPYHRYVLLLLPHPSPIQQLDIPIVPDSERLGFNTRAFLQQWGLDGVQGGGAHMWREVWNEEVTKIYNDVLKTEEPRYGVPPKPDPYADIKRTKRYI